MNCVIPQAFGDSAPERREKERRVWPPFRWGEVFIFNAVSLFFSLFLCIINRSGQAQSERQRRQMTLQKKTGAT